MDYISTEELLQLHERQRGFERIDNVHIVQTNELGLQGANLSGIWLCNVRLEQVNLSKADLSGAHLEWVTFVGCQLPDINLQAARLREVSFFEDIGTNLQRADLSYTHLVDVRFCKANLSRANLIAVYWKKVDISGANFSDVQTGWSKIQKGDVISDAATIWKPIATSDPSTRSIKGKRIKGQRAITSEESIVIAPWQGINISLPLNEARERVRHMLRAYSSGRAGQTSFRKNILAAYGDRCAISGCTIKFLLDAAHTRPHCLYPTNEGKRSKRINMEQSDGMPLHKDIHWLYDLNLIRIHPTTLEVIIDQSVKHDYGNLNGNIVQIPSSFTPFEHQKLREGLQWRWDEYGKFLEGFTPEI